MEKKYLKPLLFSWLLAVSWINAQAQNNWIIQNTKDKLCYNLSDKWLKLTHPSEKNLDALSHEDFIKTNIFDIIEWYWKEKWLDMIRKHMIQELNNIRLIGENNIKYQLNYFGDYISNENINRNLIEINRNDILENFSQTRAEKLFHEKKLEHWEWDNNLQNRLLSTWIYDWNFAAENLWQWQMSIKQIIVQRILSKEHCFVLFNKNLTDFWIWIYCTNINDINKNNKLCVTRVLTWIWKKEYLSNNN